MKYYEYYMFLARRRKPRETKRLVHRSGSGRCCHWHCPVAGPLCCPHNVIYLKAQQHDMLGTAKKEDFTNGSK